MFRPKKSVNLSYDRQGYIYFMCRIFRELPSERQQVIRDLCRVYGGDYSEALFVYLTTDEGLEKVCMDYYLSRATLLRRVKRFYEGFPREM